MLYVYLAMTGGVVVLPEGEKVLGDEGAAEIHVIDADGRVLATFLRPDVSMYSREPLTEDCPKL